MTVRTFILATFVVAKFLMQYWLIWPGYDLHRDEYLHLDQVNHLAWGYMSVPPLTSWVSLVIHWLGNGVFWVKFFPALFGALTLVVVWKTVETLKGSLYALVLAALCVLLSVLLRINTLFQPNSFDVLCWTTLYFIVIKYTQTESARWLYAGAVVFALGFLNKYNIAFWAVGIVPALLLTPQRKLFGKQATYFAAALALVLVSPNLWWQYKNGWPVIHHFSELASRQLVHVKPTQFLQSQVIFYFGGFAVILAGLYALLFNKAFAHFKFLFWTFFTTLTVFLYFKAKDYYAIGLYPVYIAFGAVHLEQMLQGKRKIAAKVVLLAWPLIFFAMIYPFAFPNQSPQYIVAHQHLYQKAGLLRWEDGKDHHLPQDFADMLGWKALANKVDSVHASLPQHDNIIVFCDNYGQAGAINYYKRNESFDAVSFNADYLNWHNYDERVDHLILVKEKSDDDKERLQERPAFDSVYLAARNVNAFAREDTISIYVLRGARIDVNNRLREEAEKKKNFRD